MRTYQVTCAAILLVLSRTEAFVTINRPKVSAPTSLQGDDASRASNEMLASLDKMVKDAAKASAAILLATALSVSPVFAAADGGASIGANAKITTGGASTLQSGRTIAITRGVNLDGSDFSNQNLKGVAFQQSML